MDMRRLSWLLMTCVSLSIIACNGSHNPSSPPADGDPNQAGDPGAPADPGHGDPLPPADDGAMATVDWAVLQFPVSAEGASGGSLDVYGRVYEPGVTQGVGRGAGITGEAGVGLVTVPPANWTWTTATFNTDTDGGANDEYMATLAMPGSPGAYRYAFRLSLFGGPWVYADLDPGTTNGFDVLDAGTLTVTPPPIPAVDWAKIVTPPNAAAVTPGAAVAARVQVYEANLTPGVGMGAGLEVQVGVGPRGGDPTTIGFSYSPAVYGRDDNGGGTLSDDQFDWSGFAPGTVGSYDLAARVRIGTGPWLYADTSGSTATDDPYVPASALPLTVMAQPSGGAVDWCRLQAPTGETTLAPAGTVTVYGQVHAVAQPGPNATTGPAGTGPTPRGQVGYGPRGSTPPTGWTWGNLGAFNSWPVSSANDEQMALLVAPASTGDYDWAWRFTMDGGAVWLYCDDNGTAGGYSPANAGMLKVQ
jgi:hypothetical protein